MKRIPIFMVVICISLVSNGFAVSPDSDAGDWEPVPDSHASHPWERMPVVPLGDGRVDVQCVNDLPWNYIVSFDEATLENLEDAALSDNTFFLESGVPRSLLLDSGFHSFVFMSDTDLEHFGYSASDSIQFDENYRYRMTFVDSMGVLPDETTITVQPGESIQDALDLANEGDVVEVLSGTYYEHPVIEKTLTLRGVDTGGGMPAIDGEGGDTILQIFSDSVVIESMKIMRCNMTMDAGMKGIRVCGSDCVIQNCQIRECNVGIKCYESCPNTLVKNCEFTNNRIGLVFHGGRHICNGNYFNDSHVLFSAAEGCYVINNLIEWDCVGISIYKNSTNNVIAGNTIQRSSIGGIWMLEDERYGPTSHNNLICHNNFINNGNCCFGYHAADDGGNAWDNGAEGNYWSGFVSVDADGDGIYDEPYSSIVGDWNGTTISDSRDYYPLVSPWEGIETVPDDAVFAIRSIAENTVPAGGNTEATVRFSGTSAAPVDLTEDAPPGWVMTPVSSTADLTTVSGEHGQWSWSTVTLMDAVTYRIMVPEDEKPGSYTISGILSADGVDTFVIGVNRITVPQPVPLFVANFTADVVRGNAPLLVNFTDLSTGNLTSWNWSFGDGNTSSEQHPSYLYTTPGVYTVTLAVNEGADTCTKPDYITVVSPLLPGDANMDDAVNQADTLRTLKEVVGLESLPVAGTDQFIQTDVHCNGCIDVGDAMYIAQYNVGLRDASFELIA